ncbi:MAG: ATP-binding protein [Cupriavidus sp.]|nr:ATP-binding protein [Cupriavidus sp.]
MEIPKQELFAVLQEFNPWWSGQPITDLPGWQRSAARQVWEWVENRETRRALLLTGARQVGKTTLLRQTIARLASAGFPPGNILYATFDHPLLKLGGLESVLRAWEELYPLDETQPRFLFLDEIQYVPEWQTWLKHQVDFRRMHRIAVTGSANPLRDGATESGVGRWETIPLPTLSFGEYLHLRKVEAPDGLPTRQSLREVFDWSVADCARIANLAKPLTAHFHDYLLRGGFPEPALENDLSRCQRLLREDVVDKVLKRDMTAFYGVRRVLDVERIFLYLCYHDGGILDIPTLCQHLEGVNRQTALNFLELFEAAHLIYRLKPYGYGKEVLRGRDKIYLADAALPGAMMLLGRKLLTQPDRLGAAVETAFFKHVYTRFYGTSPQFAYWQDRKNRDLEVDLIANVGDRAVPFEVKYQDTDVQLSKLKGLRLFMQERGVTEAYAITQRWNDLKVLQAKGAADGDGPIGKIAVLPAPLACYWMSA